MKGNENKEDYVKNVEQGALMSPNPRGMLEDFAASFLCVSSSL